MVRYEFPSMVAKDPTMDTIVKNAVGLVYGMLDTSFGTPLTTYDRFGAAKGTVRTTTDGVTEEFYVDNQPVVWWVSGGYAFLVSSFTGMLATATAAAASAASAATAAQAAAADAATALGSVSGLSDTAVANAINAAGTLSRAAVEALIAAVGMVAPTVDTGSSYKVIMLSDGTVRAVPVGTTTPAVPTGLAAVAGPTSARLSWNVSAGASSYQVYRDGSLIKSTADPGLRDTGVSNTTYSYQVSALNSYGMRSALSAALPVFMDPTLNSPPFVSITTWPTTVPTAGSCIVRVNARDIDAQILALTLAVDTGSLQPTPDPSVWILTI